MADYAMPAMQDPSPLSALDPTGNLAVYDRVSRQVHLANPQGLTHRFQLPANMEASQGTYDIGQMSLENGHIWLLMLTEQEPRLLVIDQHGTLVNNWRLPDKTDGFTLGATTLLLFEKQRATVSSYTRRLN